MDLTDHQARAVVGAAEARGFQRERGLFAWRYDAALHEDARDAATFLERSESGALATALDAEDPLPAWAAAERLSDAGFSRPLMAAITTAARERGFVETDPGILSIAMTYEWDLMMEALEFLWATDREESLRLLGDRGQLAALPGTAVQPCHTCCDGTLPHRLAGKLPRERPESHAMHMR